MVARLSGTLRRRRERSGNTMGRKESECGQMGVKRMQGTFGCTIDLRRTKTGGVRRGLEGGGYAPAGGEGVGSGAGGVRRGLEGSGWVGR
eukprot:111959-Prorocentrum_minimum.AAC.1